MAAALLLVLFRRNMGVGNSNPKQLNVSVKWVEKWTDSTSAVHFKSGVLL